MLGKLTLRDKRDEFITKNSTFFPRVSVRFNYLMFSNSKCLVRCCAPSHGDFILQTMPGNW